MSGNGVLPTLGALLLAMCSSVLGDDSVVDSKNHFGAASQLFEKGEYSAALDKIRNIKEHESKFAASRLLMSRIYLLQRKARQAEVEIKKISNSGMDTKVTLPILLESLLSQSKYEAVMELAIPVFDSDAFNSEMYVYRGRAYHGMYERLLAINSYNEALQLKPKNENALLGLATIYSETGDLNTAMKFADAVLAIGNEKNEAALIKANLLFRRNELASTALIVDKLISENPKNYKARLIKAAIYIGQSEFNLALLELNDVLYHFPNEPVAKYLQVSALQARGNDSGAYEATQELRRLLDRVPKQIKIRLPLLYYLSAIINFRAEAYELANKELNRYLAQNPGDISAMKLLATTQSAMGELFAAKETLEIAIELAADDHELRMMLAKSFIDGGKLKQAQTQIYAALSLAPGRADYLKSFMAVSLESGDYDSVYRGVALYTGSLNDMDNQSLLLIAKLFLEVKDVKQGLTYINELVEREPDSESAQLLFGSYLGLLGDPLAARKRYEKVLALNSNNHQASIHLARLDYMFGQKDAAKERLLLLAAKVQSSSVWTELGSMALNEGRQEQALRYFNRALAINPNSIVSTLNSAYIHATQKQFEAAFDVLNKFLSLNKTVKSVSFQKIHLQISLGDIDGALSTINVMKQAHDQDPQVWFLEGQAYEHHKRYKEASISYKYAIILAPEDLVAREKLILTSAKAGDAASAKHHLKKMKELSEEDAFDYRVEGDMWRYLGEFDKAKEKYESALSEGLHLSTLKGLYLIYQAQGEDRQKFAVARTAANSFPNDLFMKLALANSLQDLGLYRDCRNLYEELLAHYPNNPTVLNNAAQLLLILKDTKGSIELATRAYELAPNIAEISDTLGWSYALEGRFEEALTSLQKAELLNFEDLEITYHLAMVLFKLGRQEEAKRRLIEVQNSNDPKLTELAEKQLYAIQSNKLDNIELK